MSRDWKSWQSAAVSADEVVAHVRSGDRVFAHGAAATPTPLLDALARRTDLEGVRLYHLHLAGPYDLADRDGRGRLRSNSFFIGQGLRAAVAAGHADYIPVFLSDIPGLFGSGRIPLDVALIQLSPPNAHGQCTLGPSVDAALAAATHAKRVLAEVNVRMPRTAGSTVVPFDRVHAHIASDRPLHTHEPCAETPEAAAIGALIADLVEDGDTLQTGVGVIPDAALARMTHKQGLGVHSEMISDGVMRLMQAGVVTNERKKVHQGRTVTTFAAGSQRLLDFIDENQLVEFHPCDRTNDVALIRKNPGVVAINSALEVDLSGQVCADSIGHQMFSGVGGQMDFIRGAAVSARGKPIIALPSTAAHGTVSRITVALKPGAGVVTTRSHLHWLVTEFGAVNVHGMNLRERALALISLAHPDFRGELRRAVNAVRHFDLG